MPKAAEAFRTISEVAEDLDVPKHVLRFWEVKFAQVRPMKRGGGRRYYRPEDLELLKGIRHLLHREGYTIKGVQKILREQGIEVVKLQGRGDGERPPVATAAAAGSAAVRGNSKAGDGTAPAPAQPQPAPRRSEGQTAVPTPPAATAARQRLLDPARRTIVVAAVQELEACRALLRSPAAATGGASMASADPRRTGTRN